MTVRAEPSGGVDPVRVPTACVRRCANCRHHVEDRDSLERRIPGLAAFGSGFGASVAASRLCALHDQLVSPDDVCVRFEAALPT